LLEDEDKRRAGLFFDKANYDFSWSLLEDKDKGRAGLFFEKANCDFLGLCLRTRTSDESDYFTTRLTLIFLVFFEIVDNVVEDGDVEGSTR